MPSNLNHSVILLWERSHRSVSKKGCSHESVASLASGTWNGSGEVLQLPMLAPVWGIFSFPTSSTLAILNWFLLWLFRLSPYCSSLGVGWSSLRNSGWKKEKKVKKNQVPWIYLFFFFFFYGRSCINRARKVSLIRWMLRYWPMMSPTMIISTLWTDTASAAHPVTSVDYGEPEWSTVGGEKPRHVCYGLMKCVYQKICQQHREGQFLSSEK